MATGLDIGIGLLETIFFKTSFAGQYWIGQLVIIVATLALITRRTSDWKTLALPVMVGWKYFGMNMNWMFYAVAGIMFVVDAMSIQMIQSAIGAVSETIGYTRARGGIRGARREGKLRTEKQRMDIKAEMQKMEVMNDIRKMSLDEQKDYEIRKELRERARRESLEATEFPELLESKIKRRKKLLNKLMDDGKLE